MIKAGEKAPEFSLTSDDGGRFTFEHPFEERVLLVFYPADNTPVCTRQLCDYRDGSEDFSDLGVRVLGISKDSPESHQMFKTKHSLPFALLSDPDLEVAGAYGARGLLGMKRAVFLVGSRGVVRYAHVESLALFKRSKEELLEVIAALGPSSGE